MNSHRTHTSAVAKTVYVLQLKTAANNGMIHYSHKFMAAIRGCNSVVESHFPKVIVVGSSPIARFKIRT